MSETKSRSVLAVVAATLATGVLAYVVYFDYKRRNDTQFRRKLRKEKKRVDKTVAQEKGSSPSGSTASLGGITKEVLRNTLEQIKREDAPVTTEEKEAYFMAQVGAGEQLAAQGPALHFQAAVSFYKALRVYPTPLELVVIYQKTVPEPIFKIIVELMNTDVANRVNEYYDFFPPKSMNVEIKTNENGKRALVVTKDIAAGETIYKEFPVVAVLDADLESIGKFCSHCFRPLDQEQSSDPVLHPPEDSNPLGSTYCSQTCLATNKAQSTSLLFTQEPPLPPVLAPETSPGLDAEGRKIAQDNFVAYLKKDHRSGPLIVARFIARQIAVETSKLVEKVSDVTGKVGEKKVEEDFTDAETEGYLLADHIERLNLIEVKASEELPLLLAVFEKTLPGLEQFVTDERHSMLLGKMLYNRIGVGSRDDRPEPTARPEDVEKSRTPLGTQRQIGSAIYTVSSYAEHSCLPSGRYTFPKGTTEIHVVATKDMKKGDELTVAYVDVDQHEGESAIDARRRRRTELARGWKLACKCERCEEELSQEENSNGVKVEGVAEGLDQQED